MTISYSGRFSLLLFRWKASLWKYVWKHLLVYLTMYYAISALYQFYLKTSPYKEFYSKLVFYLDDSTSGSIPIAFLLGLYVVTMVKRWWEQFENIAWPDNIAFLVSASFRGKDEDSRVLRRTIMRYCVLAAVLAWRNVSSRVTKRFPTGDHLVKSGLMTEEEWDIYQKANAPFGRWFLPIAWIQTTLLEQLDEGKIDAAQFRLLWGALHSYKDKFIRMFVFDWVSIPLVYTQVCIVATYGYFGLCLIGRQSIDEDTPLRKHPINIYLPIFTILEFFFYMGWLTVAEHLMHPFGDEDDDFELNYILDRHLYVSFMIVDEFHGIAPTRIKDGFWGRSPVIPHTKASIKIHEVKPHSHFTVGQLPFQEMELHESKEKLF